MRIHLLSLFLIIAFFATAIDAADQPPGAEGQEVVSSMGLAFGSFEEKGFAIIPVPDISPAPEPTDLAKPMLFEIIRPSLAAFSIGRILSSCGCLSIRAPQRDFLPGQRAFIELRNTKPTPKEGATYAFFVHLTTPEELTLRFDVFVKSESAPAKQSEQTVPSEEKPETHPMPLPDLAPGA